MDEKAARSIRMSGLEFIEIMPCDSADRPFVILSTGAGIMMAFADHFASRYPGVPFGVCDLAGNFSVEQRVCAIDHVSAACPTVLLMWSSLRSTEQYIAMLEERDWHPVRTWVYLRGIDQDKTARWTRRGAVMVEELWSEFPLGNLRPTPTSRRVALATPECGWGAGETVLQILQSATAVSIANRD